MDESRAPLFVMRIPVGSTPEDRIGAWNAVREWLVTHVNRPYGAIYDTRNLHEVTASERRVFTQYDLEVKHIERRYSVGETFVISSAMIRGALTAIHWFSPSVHPFRTFAEFDEAAAWIEGLLEAGLRDFPSGPSWQGRPEVKTG